jgi:rubrerythrin
MEFTSSQSIRALHYAAEREMETRDFYRNCIERAVTPGTREILEGLVEDEQRHYDILLRLLKEVSAGVEPSPELIKTEAAKVRLERAFSQNATNDPNFQPERQNMRGILEKALEVEKESFANYMKSAGECSNPEVIAVYRYLAGEENKHYILIDNLLSYLDVPGRWLYYEENMVFQNG